MVAMTLSLLLPPLPATMDNYRKQHAKPAIPKFVSPQSCSTHSAHVYYNLLPKSIEYVYKTGQKVMGRTSIRLGKLLPGSPEDIRFRGSFGVSLSCKNYLGVDGGGMVCALLVVISFIFVGTCVHANVPPKRQHSLTSVGGA